MNTLKEQIEASAEQAVDFAQDVIRCAHELLQEQRISPDVLSETVKLCESGLPYAAEQGLRTILAKQMLQDFYTDLPDPSSFIY